MYCIANTMSFCTYKFLRTDSNEHQIYLMTVKVETEFICREMETKIRFYKYCCYLSERKYCFVFKNTENRENYKDK